MQRQELCKSVFKDGRAETTRENFTQKFIELINLIEKGKRTLTEK